MGRIPMPRYSGIVRIFDAAFVVTARDLPACGEPGVCGPACFGLPSLRLRGRDRLAACDVDLGLPTWPRSYIDSFGLLRSTTLAVIPGCRAVDIAPGTDLALDHVYLGEAEQCMLIDQVTMERLRRSIHRRGDWIVGRVTTWHL